MKKFIKKHGFNICMLILCVIGVAIVAYPTVSDYWNSRVQSKAIRNYINKVDSISEAEIERIRMAATLYNQALFDSQQRGTPVDDSISDYENILNINGDGVMGYIVIPAINVELPIYHGTEEKILQVAVGHSSFSSVPIGGKNTNAILLGHRGLPSARLFNDLDQIVTDDYFEIHVLDEVLYYKVYDIAIIEPKELNNLRVMENRDMVTLVTCTPYGVNTHRLLIYGQRVDNIQDESLIYADARKISNIYAAIAIGVALWLVAMFVLIYISAKVGHQKISYKEQMRRRRIISKYQK